MTELMMKMTSWLIAAMALGFIVAWLLSQNIYNRKKTDEEDNTSSVILERNNMIDKLEKKFRNERVLFENLSNDLKNSEKTLAKKTSLLTTLQNTIANSDSNKNNNLALREKNNSLLIEIKQHKQTDIKRVFELEGLEEILLLAEEKVEENEKNYRQILKKMDEDIEFLTSENEKNKINIKVYQKSIKNLEEELTIYRSDSLSPEFIISRDQFLKIEEQLELYQVEIKSLKNENSKLLSKSQKSFKGVKFLEDKAVVTLGKGRNDGSMVKAFRETYKKITKS